VREREGPRAGLRMMMSFGSVLAIRTCLSTSMMPALQGSRPIRQPLGPVAHTCRTPYLGSILGDARRSTPQVLCIPHGPQRRSPVHVAQLAVRGKAHGLIEAPGPPVAVENPEGRVLMSPRPEDPFGPPREHCHSLSAWLR
jgi:hypothetical protein